MSEAQVTGYLIQLLQVVALLLPVVILTGRFLDKKLAPRNNPDLKSRARHLQGYLKIGTMISLILLAGSGVLLITAVNARIELDLISTIAVLLLLMALLVFSAMLFWITRGLYSGNKFD